MNRPLVASDRPLDAAQMGTALCVVLAIYGSVLGSGALGGTPIEDAAGGIFSADATLLAPAPAAFAIWSTVYVGLAVFAVYQFGGPGRSSHTLHRLRGPAAASALLNPAWIGTVQLGWVALSVVVMFLLLASLIWVAVLLRRHGSATRTERWIMWITFGTYLGWVCVATMANVAAWLAALGVGANAAGPVPTAVGLLAVAAGIAVALTIYTRGQLAPAVAITWGLAWIGVGRLAGNLESAPVGSAALCIAALTLLASAAAALRARRERKIS